MSLIFFDMNYIKYFFCFIMSFIAIKTYYDTIKTIIFIQVYYMHYVFQCILCQLFL
jgi:hypothetical protein